MNHATFVNLAKNRFEACMSVLEEKNAEYSRGGDKLHNFKRASKIIESENYRYYPEDALAGMWVKHLVSILDMVDDIPNLPTIKILRAKMTDAINYLVLLEALFMERIDLEPERENDVSDDDADKIIDQIEAFNEKKVEYKVGIPTSPCWGYRCSGD